ncbi:MAG TPA: RagB/SusD family nutrient uptake outer membrane protein [Pricia sp.]|nr:RagB/SusD family nutrient uptake outer membrane protein [Pricia sp.]
MSSNRIKPILWVAALLILCGCNDDFLERAPLDNVSDETFWNTESDLMVYNNNFYNMVKEDASVPILMGHEEGFDSNNTSIWFLDEFSDNMTASNNRHNLYRDVRSGIHVVSDESRQYGYRGWNFVRSLNIGLQNYDLANVSEEIKNKYRAEARFFRGWFYAEKVSKFGDITWLDEELTTASEELFGPRTPRNEVMANVLADLDFAVEHLPESWGDGGNHGRMNHWIALLIKSRVCLFEGTWRKYHGLENPDMWLNEAASAAKELIDNGPFSLYSTGDPEHDYNAFHRVLDLDGNPEVMHWRKYDPAQYTNHVMSYWRGYNGGATKSAVEDYLCTDGLPISLSPLYEGDATIEDVFENRDPRLRQTILHPDDRDFYNFGNSDLFTYPRVTGMEGGSISLTGYHIIKVYDVEAAYRSYNTSWTPAITLRFAEALLNYAEAKAELGTITQEDIDLTINKLRDRVAMPHLDMTAIPEDPRHADEGISPLLVEIRRERRVELFMEGFRYNDLRRWKQGNKLDDKSLGLFWDDAANARYEGNTVITAVDPESGKTYIDAYGGSAWANPQFDESKHYLWPLPLEELSQNPDLGQNPGW